MEEDKYQGTEPNKDRLCCGFYDQIQSLNHHCCLKLIKVSYKSFQYFNLSYHNVPQTQQQPRSLK